MQRHAPSAAVITIGNEVLRGDTVDANKAFLGAELTARGIDVRIALSIPDEQPVIAAWTTRLAAEYTYVLVSGGIGPTPDDVTRQALAAAFQRELVLFETELGVFERQRGVTLSSGQREMWRLPAGCELIFGEGVGAPGFRIENVHVFAGVPHVLRAMWAYVADRFEGVRLHVERFRIRTGESRWAHVMVDFVARYPELQFGSYPRMEEGWYAEVTVRGEDRAQVEQAAREFEAEILLLGSH